MAKATLYTAFGSKDELIRAYLTRRYEAWKEQVPQRLARYDNPRDRLLGVFDLLAKVLAHQRFHGCAFMNAFAEDRPGGPAEEPSREYRESVRSLFAELAQAAGAADPDHLARKLALLYDGATVAARMDQDPGAGGAAREIAAALVDAAIAAPRRRTGGRSRSGLDG